MSQSMEVQQKWKPILDFLISKGCFGRGFSQESTFTPPSNKAKSTVLGTSFVTFTFHCFWGASQDIYIYIKNWEFVVDSDHVDIT